MSKADTTRINPTFRLPLDLANAPDIDGGGRPANSATIQRLAEYLDEMRLSGADSVLLLFRTPDNTVTWQAWGNWNWHFLAGYLMRIVRKLTT